MAVKKDVSSDVPPITPPFFVKWKPVVQYSPNVVALVPK